MKPTNRLKLLQNHLLKPDSQSTTHFPKSESDSNWNPPSDEDYDFVRIGNISLPVQRKEHISNPELIPRNVEVLYKSTETLEHLRWLMQKYLMKQDVLLLG
jgi:hypothetical protein